ncbi:MAG: hypothetical protein EA398_12975 [Deltaproteobacteria bacterium]|nr:MAG: hypothetical protein EA398_12975 [Deltaproteobacteria bacterium]
MLCAVDAGVSWSQELARYDLEDTSWNGLSSLKLLAEERVGVSIEQVAVVDLGTMADSDVVLWLYPRGGVPVEAVSRWARAGGQMVLADDFGASAALLERLGLARVPVPSSGVPVVDDNPALPVLVPLGEHRLTRGVHRVMTNHPTGLRGPDGAVLGFGETEVAGLYDMRLGEGRIRVLSDPSIFINLMLPLGDNRRLVTNLIEAMCEEVPGPCRVLVVAADSVVTGPVSSRETHEWSDVVDGLESALRRFGERQPSDRAFRVASLVLLAGALPFLVALFPVRRQPTVLPPRVPPSRRPGSRLEQHLRTYRSRADHVVPAMLLRDVVEPILYAALDMERPPMDDSGRAARAAAAERMARSMAKGPGARVMLRRRIASMLDGFAALPVATPFMTPPRPVPARTWRRWIALSTRILQQMELDDAYRRRVERLEPRS